MNLHTIISVAIVDGQTLSKSWRLRMQRVTTDKDVFIDNMPGVRVGTNPPGTDWSARIGQSVSVTITDSSGFKWISLVADNLKTTSNLAKTFGMTTNALKQKLVDNGYLEVLNGEYAITPKGKQAGGRSRKGTQHGPYFVWPPTIELS